MRWKELPGSLDPHARELVTCLRRLKDHSGLSLKSLQAKTPFSASSWERYLNGKALPPPTAVEALATVAGADPAPLLVLRDAAERSTADASRATARAPAPDERTGNRPNPAATELRIGALALAAGALLLSATVSVLLVIAPWRPSAPARATAGPAGVGKYSCAYTRRGDLTFAGNSTTTSRLIARNSTGPEVAEAQCLLRRHRLSPGDVDGYFGERTEAQVVRLQRRDHVPADGIVGEQTWALLRHAE